MRGDDIYALPKDLIVPVDDGACDHLMNQKMPDIALINTAGQWVDLSYIRGYSVIFCYPRTGRPNIEPPDGWNCIPGARGCTPQMVHIDTQLPRFQAHQIQVFALSTQSRCYQKEMALRLTLHFDVLSDATLAFSTALGLPTFCVNQQTLIKRLTLIVQDGVIRKVFYPVFPPDQCTVPALAYFAI